ncbi:MAG: hypothetical protein WCA30_11945 [Dermatophilaceae bacterium]
MAQLTWTVTGCVAVEHVLPELARIKGASSALHGVEVTVQARSKIPFGWGPWTSWGTAVTNGRGRFTLVRTRGGDRRQFRIKVLFDDDRLRIKEGGRTGGTLGADGFPIDVDLDLTDKDWFVIHDDRTAAPVGRRAGWHDLGTLLVGPRRVRELADLWILVNLALDDLESMGSRFGLGRKQVVKYPMGVGSGSPASASYSNPRNGTVYIKADELHSRTILHELMHQWAYDRTRGEDAMAWQLVRHRTTNAAREATTFVPFHEAFADWAAYEMLRRLSNGELTAFLEDNSESHPGVPHSRAFLVQALGSAERFLDTVAFTEQGWRSFFTLLTCPTVDRLDPDATGTIAGEGGAAGVLSRSLRSGLTFRQVLDILNSHAGTPGANSDLRNSDLDFDGIVHRAQRVHPELADEVVAGILSCLDPLASGSPRDGVLVPRLRSDRSGELRVPVGAGMAPAGGLGS